MLSDKGLFGDYEVQDIAQVAEPVLILSSRLLKDECGNIGVSSQNKLQGLDDAKLQGGRTHKYSTSNPPIPRFSCTRTYLTPYRMAPLPLNIFPPIRMFAAHNRTHELDIFWIPTSPSPIQKSHNISFIVNHNVASCKIPMRETNIIVI